MSKIFRYRAIFDVDVHVRPLTLPVIEQRMRRWRQNALVPRDPMDPLPLPSEEELVPQRALLEEICRDAAFLRGWMASGIMVSLQDGEIISDDLELEDPYELVPDLVQDLSRASQRAMLDAITSGEYSFCLDEVWLSIDPVPGRIEIGLRSILPEGPDQLVGGRFRAIVPLSVEVAEAQDISVARIARRRAETGAADPPWVFETEHGVEIWPPPLPDERELDPTREVLGALHAAPSTLDRIIRSEILAGIRDGLLGDCEPPPMPMDALLDLVDRLSPEHRASLLRHPIDGWSDRAWDVVSSFEEETVGIMLIEVHGAA